MGAITTPYRFFVHEHTVYMLTLEGLIAVFGLVLTAFGLGYAMGCNDTQK